MPDGRAVLRLSSGAVLGRRVLLKVLVRNLQFGLT